MRKLTEKILEQEYGFVCPSMGKVEVDGKDIEYHDWYYKKGSFEIWWLFTGHSTVDIFYHSEKLVGRGKVDIINLPMIKYCEDLEYIYKLVTGRKLNKIKK